ncbi:MAG: hypothetical protein HLUCCA04_12710 [Oceanicaulis sp. HLUCCA04]|nr:MAG: hypothetical protein HLUCCA04_12710 [Oceanicaulis sp. HLUCCA04]
MLMMTLSAIALTQAEPAGSALRDAWLTPVEDGSADLWLALDGQPSALTVSASDGALDLVLDAFPCIAREIIPPAARPVSRVSLAGNEEGGCTIRLEGRWGDASAILGDSGVLVSLGGIEMGAMSLRPVAQAVARPDPGASPAANAEAGTSAPALENTSSDSPARPVSLASGGGACVQTAERLEDTPWDLGAMSAHGDCLAGSGNEDDAAVIYERVLAFEPGHYGAALGLARLRAAQGDTAAAAQLFQTAAASARTDGEALAARQAAQDNGSR